jgi:hypothetical protein
MRRSALIALCAVLSATALLSAPRRADATSVTWSPAALVENQPPFANSPALYDVSCPSSGFCAAGETGGIEVSDRPGGGAWRLDPVGEATGSIPRAISCPSRQLCAELVFDARGSGRDILVTSGHPAEGSGAWTARSAPLDLSTLACPTQRVCLSMGDPGVLITTHPRAGRSAWHPLGVGTGNPGPSALACHGARLCVAVDANDAGQEEVAVSTRPATRRAWRVTKLPPVGPSQVTDAGVACASMRLCVITDDGGHVLTSTDPSAAHPRWRPQTVPGAGAAVACPSTSLCVSSAGGRLATSTDGGRRWHTTSWSPPPSNPIALACGSINLCVAVDRTDDVLASVEPSHGATAYSRVNLGQGTTAIDALACPSPSFCVAEGADGRTLRSTDPAGGAVGWGAEAATGRAVAESCPSLHFCAGGSLDAHIWVGDPTLPAPTWVPGPPGQLIGMVSCASSALCVAVGEGGAVLTSTDPLGGPGSWTTAQLATPIKCDHFDGCVPVPLDDVSCPTATFCAAIDGAGGVWTSADPTGGAGAWARTQPPGDDPSATTGYALTPIACPTASLCVIAETDQVQSTADPLNATPTWTSAPLADPGRPPGPFSTEIQGLSCSTAGLCVAVDGLGFAFSGDPADAPETAWTSARLTDSPLTAVSCAPSSLCVAADQVGDVYAGLPG